MYFAALFSIFMSVFLLKILHKTSLALHKNFRQLYYPYNDDEICAFIVRRRGKFFTFINTQIPLEKQIFAAAHELYHLWYSKIEKWELLRSIIVDNQIENTGRLNKEEAKAIGSRRSFLFLRICW